MHYEGCPVSSYYVIAKFASVQIIFGATVYGKQYQRSGPEDLQDQGTEEEWQTIQRRRKKHGRTYGGEKQGSRRTQQSVVRIVVNRITAPACAGMDRRSHVIVVA